MRAVVRTMTGRGYDVDVAPDGLLRGDPVDFVSETIPGSDLTVQVEDDHAFGT